MSAERQDMETDDEGLPGAAGHFTPEQVELLNERLDRRLLKKNPDGKTYLEGYTVINHLNRIFGYGSWSRRVVARWQEDALDGDKGILYGACVGLSVTAPDGTQSYHEDDGYCVAPAARETGKISLQSRETARKGAVTDALKRAARSLGEQFANNLYDKEYMANRAADERQAAQTQPATPRRPMQAFEPTAEPAANPAEMKRLQDKLVALMHRDSAGKAEFAAKKLRISALNMRELTDWGLWFEDRAVNGKAEETAS